MMLAMWKVAKNSSVGILRDSALVFGEETEIHIVVFVPVDKMESASVFHIEKKACVFVW